MSDYWTENDLIKPNSWVVCAANRLKTNGRIICGARHWDAVMRSQVKDGEGFGGDWEQGFVNQFCEFLTREEAWEIARKNGQIINHEWDNQKTLYSESLY